MMGRAIAHRPAYPPRADTRTGGLVTHNVQVRRADATDAAALTGVMSAAFMTDPVANWCFPDPAERPRLHPAFFGAFVDLVLATGRAYTTDGLRGVALWLDV